MRRRSFFASLGLSTVLAGTAGFSSCPGTPPPLEPGWVIRYEETFDEAPFTSAPTWASATDPEESPFADDGSYFQSLGMNPPAEAYRARGSFGQEDWLTVESYSRSASTPFSNLFQTATDPADPSNRVLRIASPAHTDGTVVRPTVALPEDGYRVCLRVGFADFGDGIPGTLNGYDDGRETSEPWYSDSSIGENGFYWLTILSKMPMPRNNVWIHHYRKVVIDSDNNQAAWTEVWNGSEFIPSGEHPVMMFALDPAGFAHPRIGKPFIPYSAGNWQPSGTIRAVDSYLNDRWYRACVTRKDGDFTLSVEGEFRYGGTARYEATIPASQVEQGAGTPDWFMFGDPHTNYYEGNVLYDDVTLELWEE